MTKLQKIIQRRDSFNIFDVYKDRQDRLKELVKKHSIEHVSIAGDWSEGTVKQYIRVSNPQSISEIKLVQAETVLKGL